ncbi:MAG TPA: site-specific integrase [Longimicrobiales bacterium]|nr:site-specific integrase [Longimicrobiales bacterium]
MRTKRKVRKRYAGNLERLATGYRWRVMLDGKVYRFMVPTDDRDRAEDFAVEKYAELRRKRRESRRRPRSAGSDFLPFSALVARFREDRLPVLAKGTQKSYRHVLDAAEEYFIDLRGDPTVDDIAAADIAEYLSWRRSRPRGHHAKRAAPLDPKTLRKHRAVLSAMFDHAKVIGAVSHNPVADVPATTGDGRDPVILSSAQYDALVAACTDPMVRTYILVLGESGARSESEVRWLRWEDVDLENSRINIRSDREHRTKAGRGRRVPMTARLRDAMRAHFAAYRFAGSPWLFHHVRRAGHAERGERIRSLRRAVEGAASRAKLPATFRQHDLRHRRATKWLAEGASVVHVKEALGHADIATTMGYTHLADQHVDALLEHEDRRRGKSVAN